MPLYQYFRFCVVGGIVGLLALGAMALAELLLPATRVVYVVEVLVVYAVGVVLSYLLQKRFTFAVPRSERKAAQFHRFVAIALLGAALTTGLSFALKYFFRWPESLAGFSGSLSFALACLLTSLLTFFLNRQWVFSPHRP